MAEQMEDFENVLDPDNCVEDIFELGKLKEGDHLAVEGTKKGIEYWHHGIFLGFKLGVADFGSSADYIPVGQKDFRAFVSHDGKMLRLVRIKYREGKCLSPEEVIKRAKQRISNPKLCGRYNLISNNCEHFATFCKTGVAESKQVNEKIQRYIDKSPLPFKKVQFKAVRNLLQSSCQPKSSSTN